jgi:ATP-dependent DNA helicase RecG
LSEGIHELLKIGETENVEFKETDNEAFYKTLSAFSNGEGGTVVLGVNDRGEVKGIKPSGQYITDLTNRIVNNLSIRPRIKTHEIKSKRILTVEVEKGQDLVGYKGHYYTRVGNTTREMTPKELRRKLLSDVQWDALSDDFSLDEIDTETVKRFIRLSREKGRLDFAEETESVDKILSKLDLIVDGKLTNGAILLFGKNPQKHFDYAVVRIGRFKTPTTIIGDRWIRGNLFQQVREAIEAIQGFINVRYEIKGRLERYEIWDYPLDALREALINALIHRDYLIDKYEVTVKIYEDSIQFYNPGELPDGITIEDLKKPSHDSIPRNKLIARVFYLAGYIEQWGTGTHRMIEDLKSAGLPEPQFESHFGFRVWFYKDIYTEEKLRELGLSERQIKAVMYVKERGRITNREYQELTGVSRITATRDLSELIEKKVLKTIGTAKRNIHYVLL